MTQNNVTRSGCIASLKRAARAKLAFERLIVELKGCADRAAALAYATPD
jgi:hypothetical protein